MIDLEEQEFLAAIAAEPDDEFLRLAYADHLVAAGDIRGEFVDAQVTLGRATRHRPPRTRAEIAERKLLPIATTRWKELLGDGTQFGSFLDPGGRLLSGGGSLMGPTGCFDRGVPVRAAVGQNHSDLERLADLFDAVPTLDRLAFAPRDRYASRGEIFTSKAWKAIAKHFGQRLRGLEWLDERPANLRTMRPLAELDLQTLSGPHHPIGQLILQGVLGTHALEEIALVPGRDERTARGVLDLIGRTLETSARLRRLSLQGFEITNILFPRIAAGPIRETIEEIVLDGCRISPEGWTAICETELPNLRRLSLHNVSIVSSGQAGLFREPGVRPDNSHVERLLASPTGRQLEWLDVWGAAPTNTKQRREWPELVAELAERYGPACLA